MLGALAAGWVGTTSAEPAMQRLPESEFGGHIAMHSAGPANAPTVVLVHGLGESGAQDWQRTIPALTPTYRVLAPDLPGFGQSDQSNQLYSPDALARALHDVLKDHRPFVLVGHSLGAAVALSYAHQFPQDLRRLVLVSMAGVLHRSVYSEFLGHSGLEAATGVRVNEDSWVARLTRGILDKADRIGVDPALVLQSAWLRNNLLRGDPPTIAALALASHDFGRALRETEVPTAIIWGDSDRIAPLRTGRIASALLPRSDLTVLDGIGHLPMHEAPERFNKVILDAIASDIAEPEAPRSGNSAAQAEDASCRNQDTARFSGDYRRLEIDNCDDVLIENARIEALHVVAGSVRLRDTRVTDGIHASASDLETTNGLIRGAPPLTLDSSRLDAAGTRFVTVQDTLVRNTGQQPLMLRFSVSSREHEEGGQQLLHDVVRFP